MYIHFVCVCVYFDRFLANEMQFFSRVSGIGDVKVYRQFQ